METELRKVLGINRGGRFGESPGHLLDPVAEGNLHIDIPIGELIQNLVEEFGKVIPERRIFFGEAPDQAVERRD